MELRGAGALRGSATALLLVAGALSTPGCHARPAATKAAAGEASDSGRVLVTGRVVVATEGAPLTLLYLDSGTSVGIVGPLLPEIQRLSGAKLTLMGTPDSSTLGRRIEVHRYAVLEVNGEKPQVGVVVRHGSDYALSRETGLLAFEPLGVAPFAELVGAKIWATGVLELDRLRVLSYGIIRPK